MISINIIVTTQVSDLFPLNKRHLRKYSQNVLKESGFSKGEANIVFIDDEKMTSLNEDYKKRKGSTDVLSFNLSDDCSRVIDGEVYISLERAHEQSFNFCVPVENEILRLVTHGLLHLAGYIHDTEEEYSFMEETTERFVQSFSPMARTNGGDE